MRTPMLPWPKASALLALTDEAAVELALRELFTDPLRRQAIYIASADLHTLLLQWLDNKIHNPSERKRVVNSLAKYTLRMASRCTPFGLFAGISVGTWAHASNLVLHDEASWVLTAALDAAYTDRLRAELMKPENGIRPYLKYYSNTSLYYYQDKLKYTVLQKNQETDFTTNTATCTPYLRRVIDLAREGCSFDTLLQALNAFTYDNQESEHFLHELINHQILVPNLNASPNGGLYEQKLANILNTIPAHVQPAVAKEFAHAHKLAKSGTAYASQSTDPTNMPILFTAAELAGGKNPFHIDLHKPLLDGKLDFSIAGSIRKGITVLQRLASVGSNKRLEQFKESFSTRYENTEVCLLELLDADSGIPYNSIITDFTPLLTQGRTNSPPKNASAGLQMSFQEAFLLRKLMACRSSSSASQYILLTDSDLNSLPQIEVPQPDSLYAICSLVASDDENNYSIHLTGASANAAGTFARFTHSNVQVEALAADIANKEDLINSGKIVAELVYLDKNPRLGNIAQRRIARKYEIPFIGLSSEDGTETIHLADIYVGLRDNRFYFRSASHNQEVIIKLTSAHNHQKNAHPVVHFLGDVQRDYPILAFSWGQITAVVQHLPRVYYRDIILSLESWYFNREDFTFLTPKGYKLDELQRFWSAWGIAQRVYVGAVGSDNKILIDLNNTLCIEIFVEEVKKHNQVVIHEFMMPPSSTIANKEGEPFVNELLAFFTLSGTRAATAAPVTSVVSAETQFLPGSEWLYYKIYAGTKSVDQLLTSAVARLTKALHEEGLIDSWFFIRYVDPDYHLRFRLHVTAPANMGTVLNMVNKYLQPLADNGTISRVQLDTYVPEVLRYGATSLAIAEQLFYWDSASCLPVLTAVQCSAQAEQNRWLAIAYSLHSMLDDFAVPITARLTLLTKLVNVYGTPASKSIAATYRAHKALLRRVLQREVTEDVMLWQNVYDSYTLRSRSWQPAIEELLALKEQNKLQVDIYNFISSIMHMTINRMCLTKSNQHEHILYNLLYKYYTTEEIRRSEIVSAEQI